MENVDRKERRRSSRLPAPACPRCQYEWVSVTVRTSHAFYCRCEVCGEVWPVRKPDPPSDTSAQPAVAPHLH